MHWVLPRNIDEAGRRLNVRPVSCSYSGADMSILVRDALMQPVRELQKAQYFVKVRSKVAQYESTSCPPGV